MKSKNIYMILIAFAVVMAAACKQDEVFDNPYEGGKPPLGVQMSTVVLPNPQQGADGTTVTFAVTGLVPYKDKLVFMFNGTAAEVVSVTDALITVKVPPNASTGVATIVIGDQVFFGPRFKVLGKLSVDPAWTVLNGGANKDVSNAYQMNDGRLILVGTFTDYDLKGLINPINRIVRTLKDGPSDLSFRSGGADGPLASIIPSGTNLFVAGSFGGFYYNNGKATLTNINNVTRLAPDGTVDSVLVNYGVGKKKAVPAFNGGTNVAISKIFAYQNKITAIGNFRYYISRQYDPLGFTIRDTLEAPQVIRMNTDGSLDKSYRFSTSINRGLPGGNGSVLGGVQLPDGRMVLAGNFTKFDSIAASRIVRLKLDGTLDATFNSGTGADKAISYISYSSVANKFLIAGTFTTYNGQPAKGLAMLNADGTLDNTFSSKGFTAEGSPTFAKQLSNGLILVSGSFLTYSGVRRSGLMVLSSNGDLAVGYNSIGDFTGFVRDILETTNASGKLTVLLMGGFTQIDGLPISNITRLVFEP